MHYSKKRNSTTKLHLNKYELIEEIQNEEMNKECFDCGSENPEYISINNGIFLCKNCIYYHYKFPDYISTLIKNNLEILGEKELKYLFYGGNKRLSNYMYIKFPDLKQYQPDILYKSDELKFYRNKLATIVNESEMADNKLFLSQNNFYHSMTDKRTKNKFGLDENNNLYNNNDLKRKYNYRKIPVNKSRDLNEKYSSKTERPLKSMANTTRKQYKKRLIPNRSPISRNHVDSCKNSPSLRENRFFNESNYFSNDPNSIKRKTFEKIKYNTNNDRFDCGNNSGNYTNTNSMLNNSSNDDKYMNYSYKGQNINYRNYISNTINANSPNNNNLSVNFKTENSERDSKSPLVGKDYLGGVGYNYNSKLSKYQSFYNKYNFEIPNKLVLSNQGNKSLILPSERVYSKPKLPKYKVPESRNKKIRLNSQILNDLDNKNYLTIQNMNSDKIRKKLWIKSSSPRLFGKEGNSLSPDFIFDSNKNTPLRLDDLEQRNSIKENGKNNFIFDKNKKYDEIKIKYDINENGENLVVKVEENNNNGEINNEKKENGMNENENNCGNHHEFVNGNESNDNFVINGNNSQNKFISVKRKENESNTTNKLKTEPLNKYLNNVFSEKPLDPINVMGNSNEIKMQENDEINSKDIINFLFSNEHNIKQVNDRNKKIKNRHKRNKKIVKREKEERLKMEKEEKIQKERENKQKMEEEERKNQFKKKFTKKERLKMIQEERLMMEQEEIKRKKEKENEDKVIKEEAEEDEQDDDEIDQKPNEIEKIEERLEEEEMDLDENENENGEQKIEENNEDQKIKQNNEELINENEEKEKEKEKEKLKNEKEDFTKTEVNNENNEDNTIVKEENLKRENDNKIIIEENKVKDSKDVDIGENNIIKNKDKDKEKDKNEEENKKKTEITEIKNDKINKNETKEKIESKEDKKLYRNIQIINKINSKEFKDKENEKKLFENKINKQINNRNKGNDERKENASNGKSTNISSENKEFKDNKEIKEIKENAHNYKTLDIDETFKNSIRNKYKRKRKLMNDSFNKSIV